MVRVHVPLEACHMGLHIQGNFFLDTASAVKNLEIVCQTDHSDVVHVR